MCIICNVEHEHIGVPNQVMSTFDRSRRVMKEAADAMLEMSRVTYPKHRRRYDRTHKEMVRLMRMWNRLEQTRERVDASHTEESKTDG